eukprot:gene2078-1950_t
MRITTWNINGIRSLHDEKTDQLSELFSKLESDIICVQETKISKNQVTEKLAFLNSEYESFWSFSTVKKGYSGVATFVKKSTKKLKVISAWKDLNDEDIDKEGRCIITDHGDFVLFNLYVPNGGRGDERIDFKMKFKKLVFERMKFFLDKKRNVVILGDINTAHKLIDIHQEKPVEYTGFLEKERKWFDDIFKDNLFIDVFRFLNPNKIGYSWFDPKSKAKERNKGWRLDYMICNENFMKKITSCDILVSFEGSDHVPVYFDFELKNEEKNYKKIGECEIKNVAAKNFNHLVKKQSKISNFFKRKRDDENGEEKKKKKLKEQ